ncbi:hypothetical protein ANANG_G00241620, partial [Anguilla anguilla]
GSGRAARGPGPQTQQAPPPRGAAADSLLRAAQGAGGPEEHGVLHGVQGRQGAGGGGPGAAAGRAARAGAGALGAAGAQEELGLPERRGETGSDAQEAGGAEGAAAGEAGRELQARQELQRRFEDQELQGRSLPAFRLVDTPEGLPNALFGDVAMVTDFLNCYSGLLTPDGRCPVAARALMEALAGEGAGFAYLNAVLLALLQTLLQDELAEGYRELDVPLSEIPLTAHSASELVRLCLRPSDAQAGDSGRGSEVWAPGGYDDVLSADFLERLEAAEVFELSAPEKVGLLVALCHRILMTYSAEDHVEAVQQRIARLWKDRLATLKDANDRKRPTSSARGSCWRPGRRRVLGQGGGRG